MKPVIVVNALAEALSEIEKEPPLTVKVKDALDPAWPTIKKMLRDGRTVIQIVGAYETMLKADPKVAASEVAGLVKVLHDEIMSRLAADRRKRKAAASKAKDAAAGKTKPDAPGQTAKLSNGSISGKTNGQSQHKLAVASGDTDQNDNLDPDTDASGGTSHLQNVQPQNPGDPLPQTQQKVLQQQPTDSASGTTGSAGGHNQDPSIEDRTAGLELQRSSGGKEGLHHLQASNLGDVSSSKNLEIQQGNADVRESLLSPLGGHPPPSKGTVRNDSPVGSGLPLELDANSSNSVVSS